MSRVLVVEDSATQAAELRLVLGAAGFDVETALDGRAGVDRALGGGFDVVLSDVLMPELNGYELCRELRGDERTRRLPIVLLTMLDQPLDLMEGLASGADNFIIKPFDPEYLVCRLRGVIENRRLRDSEEPEPGAVTVVFHGKSFRVRASREQMLDLLLSAYEGVLHTNERLQGNQAELAAAKAQLQHHALMLETQANLTEEKYRSFLAGAQDAFVVLAQNGRILEANPGAQALLQRAESGIVGKVFTEFFDDATRPAVLAVWGQAWEQGSARLAGLPFQRPDGRTIRIDGTVSVVEAAGLRFAVAIARDATEEHRAQDALRASEERFRTLVGSLDDFVATLDTERRFTGFYGRPPARDAAALLGKTVAALVPDDLVALHDAQIGQALAGQSVSYEWSGPVEGKHRDYQTSISPLRDAAGAVVGAVSVTRDVTELKSVRDQLALSDRMASLGTMAAGIAHEINNPLAAISLNLEYAVRCASTADASQRANHCVEAHCPVLGECGELHGALAAAREATAQASAIARDLKVFSHPDQSKTEALDVRGVLDAALRIAESEIRVRGRVVRSYAAVPPVAANQSRLAQVFLNLLVNAAHALPEQHGERNEIRVVVRAQGEQVVVEISDTGAGMSPEVRARIFEPFFTTKPVGIGTGLGLPLSDRIVAALGGRIEVESELGRGSTFRVLLPASTAPAPAVGMMESERPTRRRGRILVVDDEVRVAEAIRRTLSRDHAVRLVSSAEAALELIAAGERYDAIVSDLMMPGMSGMDLHAKLCEFDPAQARKIIFVTGGAFSSAAKEFLEQTENPTLEKPFEPEALRALIAERVA